MRTYVRVGLLLAAVLALGVLAGRGQPAYAWSYPAALNTNAATDSGHDGLCQVATDGGGNWLAVWESTENLGGTIGTDPDILVARSTDNGATWTAPAALNTNAATDSGDDAWPQVTTDGLGLWVAVWHSGDSLGGTIGTDWDILAARSTDNGATWTDPAALNTNAATDSQYQYDAWPQVTTDGTGNWLAVWESTENLGGTIGTDADILAARSTDNGATWTDPAALNTNAATDSGDDYGPQVATDGGGNWVAIWTSYDSLEGTIGTDSDILAARSTDNGATWTAPATLNTNAATDSGADGRAQVTTDGAGNWVAVWHSNENVGGTIGTDYDILVARSTDNGATWTAPATLNTNAATDSNGDNDPQVTTDNAGNWLAVWGSWDDLEGTIGTDSDILVARSTDNGATWTAPAALNTNAATDAGDDMYPQVTTDGGGNWVAVWTSYDSLEGTIGTDDDILYAREPEPEPVGGLAELPDVSGSAGRNYAALAALAAAAAVALGAGGWYARRRWVR
jgi:Neuraminidase (sialidase)